MVNPGAGEPAAWVEQVFRDSLAVLQARSGASETGADDAEEQTLAALAAAVRAIEEWARTRVR
jgi:hypothetical protein